MKERTLLVLLFFGLLVTKIHAQIDEAETLDDEILAGEGSADIKTLFEDITTDDEDLEGYSGEADTSGNGENDYVDEDSVVADVPKDKTDFENGEESNDPNVNIQLEEDEPNGDKPADDFMGSSQFFAAIIIGGSVGLLFAICVILLLLYRMRKKDEGSYAIDDEKKHSNNYPYTQGRECYA